VIISVWGEEKTGKTSFGLSAPEPIRVIELDIGGTARADWRFRGKNIEVESFAPDVIEHGDQAESVLWQAMTRKYYEWLQDSSVATIIIDSGTLLWAYCHGAYLAEIRKKAPGRQRLQPIEYREPNSRMRSILTAARQHKKHLILPHHSRDVRKDVVDREGRVNSIPTGEQEQAGFKELGYLSDIIIMTDWSAVDATSIGLIKKCGPVMTVSGITMPDITFDKVMNMIKMARGEAEDWMLY